MAQPSLAPRSLKGNVLLPHLALRANRVVHAVHVLRVFLEVRVGPFLLEVREVRDFGKELHLVLVALLVRAVPVVLEVLLFQFHQLNHLQEDLLVRVLQAHPIDPEVLHRQHVQVFQGGQAILDGPVLQGVPVVQALLEVHDFQVVLQDKLRMGNLVLAQEEYQDRPDLVFLVALAVRQFHLPHQLQGGRAVLAGIVAECSSHTVESLQSCLLHKLVF